MRAPLIWAGGLIGSLAAHGLAFAFLNISVEPDPTPTQPKPETQLSMDAYQVDRQDAPAQETPSEAAREAEGETTDLAQGAIPQSRSEAQSPDPEKLVGATAAANALTPAPPEAPAVSAQTPQTNQLTQSQTPTETIAPVAAATTTLASKQSPTTKIAPSTSPTQAIAPVVAAVETLQQAVFSQPATAPSLPASQPAATARPNTQTMPEAVPDTELAVDIEAPSPLAQTRNPNAQSLDQTAPPIQFAPNLPAPSPLAGAQTPNAPVADQQPLPAQFAKASLAWNFGDRVVTDPDALATIQAFMAPQAIDGSEQVRDGLSSLLTSVDCARLSATFIPETGALELRGHVPDNALRAPVLKALQDQIGEGITVTDNLLHLPKPQCGALSGIADVGLPQSTDQLTNKRLIGDNAQAVEYTYAEGQALAFDLTAPDYDAVVYVDYFDADGQVIHLVPNEVVGLQAYEAKAVVGIERGDGPRLNITIGPPFGQEIAVAFAASRPLFDEVRPIVEPAEPYLVFLKQKVAEAREIDPDFKGEWVYFFITTQPATQ